MTTSIRQVLTDAASSTADDIWLVESGPAGELYSNGLRIADLAEELDHSSDWIAPLRDAVAQGRQAWNTAQRIDVSLRRHKALEDEARTLKATIKSIDAAASSARLLQG